MARAAHPYRALLQACLSSHAAHFARLALAGHKRHSMVMTPYDIDLDRNPANFQPLTPLSFLERAAAVFPDRAAIIHGGLRRSYAEFYDRARQLGCALARRGGVRGDTV